MEQTKAQKAFNILGRIDYLENDEELDLLDEIKSLVLSHFSEQTEVTDLGCVDGDNKRIYNWFCS
jgi:hypothetical protein